MLIKVFCVLSKLPPVGGGGGGGGGGGQLQQALIKEGEQQASCGISTGTD